MHVELSAETEALIQADLRNGAYDSATDFVERAVELLHGQELWLRENRSAIGAKIEAGWASAQRGDLVDGAEVQLRMSRMKEDWKLQNHDRK